MKKNIFKLKKKQSKEIAENLQSKIKAGFKENNKEIKALPTYINPNKNVKDGKVLVLDLGGTNFRAAIIEFSKGKVIIHPENGLEKNLTKYMKDDSNPKKEFPADELFEKMADLISGLDLKGVTSIGYCFSYPAESMLNGDATLIKWTKGVNIPEMVGKATGKLLLDYLNKHKAIKAKTQFTSIKVINDTVASLFAGVSLPDYDSYIGLIVGTGTNMASFFHADKIKKLNVEYKEKGLIPVNLESGNFQPPHLTTIDKLVDAMSGSQGEQLFEKAISGFYLGKILKYVFPSDEVEENFDARKLTTIMNYPDIHKKKYVRVARWIYIRSAQLVASSLTGLILELVAQDKSIKKICLTAEGSLFWSEDKKGKDYNKLVLEELHKLLADFGHGDIHVDINRLEDANLIGSAIAALS